MKERKELTPEEKAEAKAIIASCVFILFIMLIVVVIGVIMTI